MTTRHGAATDHEVASAVGREISWTPDVEGSRIGVAVYGGVVTLTGQVTSYPQKIAAGKAALRTASVGAVANDIDVHHTGDQPSDADVAASARLALDSSTAVPLEHVGVEVRGNFTILSGEVEWNYQREAAHRAVALVAGVHSVDNRITLTERAVGDASAVEAQIGEAIARLAALDAMAIRVSFTGGTAELSGTAQSWSAKRQAELATWSSPHVMHVQNNVTVTRLTARTGRARRQAS